MLVERRTYQGFSGKVYIILVDGKVKKGFSEHQSITALSEANEWIEEYLIHLATLGHMAQVRWS